jgi:two-component sensor histidine kinase
VRFKKPNDHYEFIIADDGKGADQGPLEDNPSSLGLRMVRTLVENQLHGSLSFSTEPGEGLRAEIQFPPVEERYG